MMTGTVSLSMNATPPPPPLPAQLSLLPPNQPVAPIKSSATVTQCLIVNQVVAIHFPIVRTLVVSPVASAKTVTFGNTAVLKKMANVLNGMTATTLQRHRQLHQHQQHKQPQLSQFVLEIIKSGIAVPMLHVWQHVRTQSPTVVEMIINVLSNVCVKWALSWTKMEAVFSLTNVKPRPLLRPRRPRQRLRPLLQPRLRPQRPLLRPRQQQRPQRRLQQHHRVPMV